MQNLSATTIALGNSAPEDDASRAVSDPKDDLPDFTDEGSAQLRVKLHLTSPIQFRSNGLIFRARGSWWALTIHLSSQRKQGCSPNMTGYIAQL